MSQHIFHTTHEGRPVSVLMGWDRPLQGFFMVIQDESKKEEFCVYNNLDDPGLLANNGLPPTLEPFVAKLEALGIVIPMAMLEGVELDGILNAGNRYVEYSVEPA